MFLHCAIPAFHAAIHQAREPELRGRPVAVAQDAAPQAILIASSEEARRRRVWSGLRRHRAERRCPGLVVRLPDADLAETLQENLLDFWNRVSPRVAGRRGRIDIDLAGTERLWGQRLRPGQRLGALAQARLIAAYGLHHCQHRIGLPAAIGGGQRRLTAQLAAYRARRRADRCWIPDAAAESAELRELPLRWLPGLHEAEQRQLADCGLERVGQLLAIGEADLVALLGSAGEQLWAAISGGPEEPVPERVAPDHRLQFTGDRPAGLLRPEAALLLRQLARELGFALRQQDQACARLQLQLRWRDGRSAQGQRRLDPAAADDDRLHRQAALLFDRLATRRVALDRLRLIGEELTSAETQLVLFDAARRGRLQSARDRLRQRYGFDIVTTGETVAD